jgi:hypothetical protein
MEDELEDNADDASATCTEGATGGSSGGGASDRGDRTAASRAKSGSGEKWARGELGAYGGSRSGWRTWRGTWRAARRRAAAATDEPLTSPLVDADTVDAPAAPSSAAAPADTAPLPRLRRRPAASATAVGTAVAASDASWRDRSRAVANGLMPSICQVGGTGVKRNAALRCCVLKRVLSTLVTRSAQR